MHRRASTKSVVFVPSDEPMWSRIRLLAIKLRGMAHLIGSQAVDEELPLNMVEVQWGCGLILEDIAAGIREASQQMEKDEIRKVRAASGKKL